MGADVCRRPLFATLTTCLDYSRENGSGSRDSGVLEGDRPSFSDCQMADDVEQEVIRSRKAQASLKLSQMGSDCSTDQTLGVAVL